MSELLLAPGERAEIIVNFAQNERVVLESKALAGHRGGGQGMGMGGGMMMAEQNPQFELIEFRAAEMLRSSASVPSKLGELPDISETHVTNTREFLLEMPGMGPLRMLGLAGGFTSPMRRSQSSWYGGLHGTLKPLTLRIPSSL